LTHSLAYLAGPDEDHKSSTWSNKALTRLADLAGSDGADMDWYGLIWYRDFSLMTRSDLTSLYGEFHVIYLFRKFENRLRGQLYCHSHVRSHIHFIPSQSPAIYKRIYCTNSQIRRIFPDRLSQTNSVATTEDLPLKYSLPKQEHQLTPYWMIVSIYHAEILLQNNYIDHHHLPMNLLPKLSQIRASQSWDLSSATSCNICDKTIHHRSIEYQYQHIIQVSFLASPIFCIRPEMCGFAGHYSPSFLVIAPRTGIRVLSIIRTNWKRLEFERYKPHGIAVFLN
jgi:hypothetical protein